MLCIQIGEMPLAYIDLKKCLSVNSGCKRVGNGHEKNKRA